MINFKNARFITSISDYTSNKLNPRSEVLLIGKSNVGKSSLINALTNNSKLAKTSSKPGHTKLLNYFEIDKRFYLVDAPGYGYASGGVDLDKLFKDLMDNYFNNTKNLKLALLLFNSERTLNDNDEEILTYLKSKNIPYLLVFTKSDKLNQKEKAALEKYIHSLKEDKYLLFSTKNSASITKLQNFIENNI